MKQMSKDPSAGGRHPDSTLLPDGTAFPFWEDRTSYRDVYHVAATHPRAAEANPGTADEPWKTIGRAADLLQPGQKVVVHAGVYREWVVPHRGGSGPDSMFRRNHVSNCGVCGIAGCNHVDETLVENNLIERIGGLYIEGMCEAAGLKFHGAKRVLIRNNVFRDHTAANGIWLDFLNENCRITGNLFYAIHTALGAVYLEACREANLVDHNVFVAIRKSDWGLPEYVRGSGVSADGANTIVAHNLFLDIEGFAVSMNDRQPGRNVGGHPIKPRGHQVLNNIFAACQRPIFLAGNSGNISDGNLFDAGTPNALFGIQNPEPGPKPGFAAWRKDLGQDAHSSQAPMDVSFDPATMTLRVACWAIRSTSPAVPELGKPNAATACPGPFEPAACRRLGEGQTLPHTVEVAFPPSRARGQDRAWRMLPRRCCASRHTTGN